MQENDSLKGIITDLFKGINDNLYNEISTENLKKKIGGKWIEKDGDRYYLEAEWGDCTYTHNENKKLNICKLKVYHTDNSIEYLYQDGKGYSLEWVNPKVSISAIDFGKYKDESILDIVIKDPNYIVWWYPYGKVHLLGEGATI